MPFVAHAVNGILQDPFHIIAHMANNQKSLDWAVSQGANAIEITTGHICRHGLGGKCEGPSASNDASAQMQHVARLEGFALYLIDSKVEAKWGSRLAKAGAAIVPFIEKNLFEYGYKGKVVIAALKFNTFDYIKAAVVAANSSTNRERYFFTFAGNGDCGGY